MRSSCTRIIVSQPRSRPLRNWWCLSEGRQRLRPSAGAAGEGTLPELSHKPVGNRSPGSAGILGGLVAGARRWLLAFSRRRLDRRVWLRAGVCERAHSWAKGTSAEQKHEGYKSQHVLRTARRPQGDVRRTYCKPEKYAVKPEVAGWEQTANTDSLTRAAKG